MRGVILPTGSGVPAPTLSGSPTIVGSWDFANTSTLHLTGSVINSIDGADGTSVSLTGMSSPVSGLDGSILSAILDGSTMYFKVANDLGLTANSGTGTIVAVANLKGTGNSLLAGITKAVGVAGQDQFMVGAIGTMQCRANDQTTLSTGVGASTTTGKHLLVGRYDSGVRKASLNADGEGTAHLGAALTGSAGIFDTTGIGARLQNSGVDLFANANIYRVIVYSSALSDANTEAVAVWAAANYGTPNNP